jgi:hypothetical protein
MRTIEYKTGRDYGSEQVLFIDILSQSTDDFDITTTVAVFRDHVRHISGKVTAISLGGSIGEAVMAEYDAGRYEAI